MKRTLPYLVIIFVCILAFNQVVLLRETLKYDILDGYLHGHFFLSECLRNNVFPLWDPYQQLGFPIHADMLNTNYIVDMLLGKLLPYTNITFHILFIVYIIIAGFGAYKLSGFFKINPVFSLCIAISYSLSGFITGNAQHIQFIIGAAWFPFALFYFLMLSREIKISSALGFVIFTHLLSTGGYPSFVILLGYILFFLFVLTIIRRAKQQNYRFIWSYLLHCTFALTVLLAMSSGMIISILQSTPYIDRYSGLTYEYAVTNPFPPSALISLLSPLVTATQSKIFPTDISMSNHYFGVIILVLLIFALFRKSDTNSLLIFLAGIFLMFLSFGEHSYVHRLMYEFVPFFDKFRHPSSFRFVTILFLLIFTGIQITRHNPAESDNYPAFKKVFLIFSAVLLLILIVSGIFIALKAWGPFDFKFNWKSLTEDYGISGPVFIQSLFILLLFGMFVFVIFKRRKTHLIFPLITAILIIESIAFTQINIPYTVTSHYDPIEIRSFIRSRPAGFPLPDNRPLSENTEESVAFIPLIKNTNTYTKSVSPWYFYPFYLDGFHKLEKDTTLFNHTIQNQLVYYADTILPESEIKTLKNLLKNSARHKNFVFIEDTVYAKHFWNKEYHHGKYDSLRCIFFSPERMTFRTFSNSPQFVILLQNNYPGWEATIDGKKASLYTVNYSVIGLSLPAGTHELTFEYINIAYEKATVFAFGIFILMLMFFIILKLIDNRKTPVKHAYALSLLLIMGIMVMAFRNIIPYSRLQQKTNRDILKVLEKADTADAGKTLILFNTEAPLPYNHPNILHKRFRFPDEVGSIQRMVDTCDFRKFIYVWSNVNDPPELTKMIQSRFPVIKVLYKGERCHIMEFSGRTQYPAYGGGSLNTYEKIPAGWSHEQIRYDSNAFHHKFEILQGAREYSSTYRRKVENKQHKSVKIYTEVKSFCNDTNSIHIVIALNRKGKTIRYHSVDIRQFASGNDGWRTGFAFQEFSPRILRRGDEIMVYCWNSGKNKTVSLDDFLVQLEN